MVHLTNHRFAVWAVTPNGFKLARKISEALADVHVYASERLPDTNLPQFRFESLAAALETQFHNYTGHIFIMATGIVIRVIAPLIQSKTEDPAVVVVDDQANHAVSLLSGHLGGANELTRKIADLIGANPVITTATDVNEVPAIDVVAQAKNLFIENPQCIKTVNMALLQRETIRVHDPFGFLENSLPSCQPWTCDDPPEHLKKGWHPKASEKVPAIFVDDIKVELPPEILILRPPSLVAGIGCNRNTDMQEMKALLEDVLEVYHLAGASLKCIASIDVKADEAGLIALAENLGVPLIFFERQALNRVRGIENPSKVVEKHVGVKSVCEAAAILAAQGGKLIVPKQSTKNVTVAVARIGFSF